MVLGAKTNEPRSALVKAAQVEICSSKSKEFAADRALAAQRMQAGDLTTAHALLQKAYILCPNDYENGLDLARADATSGDNDAAERLAQALLSQKDNPTVHSLLGTIESSRKNYKGAAAQYQIAATMEPSEENTFAFGTSLMKVNFGAAAEVLRYGLRTYPLSVKIHVALAVALYAQDQAEEGAKLLCEASDIDTSDVRPMEVLSDTQVIPRSIQPEAEKHLADLHRRFPKDGVILFDYAMVKSGRWSGDKAASPSGFVGLLNAALVLDPHLAKAYFELSTIYDAEKDYPSEIAALKKAIAIDPNAEQSHFRLAFAYRQAGDQAHFQEELARFQELHAKAAMAH